MEKEKIYGVWAVRSGASIFGRAEAWCKEDGKPLEFTAGRNPFCGPQQLCWHGRYAGCG